MAELATYAMRIGDEWQPAESGATFDSLDPSSGEPWATLPDAAAADVDRAVAAARTALRGPWATTAAPQRARLMRRLADLIEADADRIAVVETRDNGKLLREMRGQVGVLPEWLHYYAGLADKLEGQTIPARGDAFLIYTRHEPVGVVAAIVPWNSPLLLLLWKLAPALAAGCTFVAKPSPHTSASALELARLVDEAGFPPGVFNVVTSTSADASQALVAHPDVAKVAFTGSTKVGVEVAKTAADHLARLTLELGGKSAQVVFEDADLEAAANGVIAGIFAASGQTCIAGSRLLAHESIADELVQRVAARAATIRLGDPMLPESEMGPLNNATQLATFTGFVESALAEGGRLVCGGGVREDLGPLFVEPTIVGGVGADARVVQEEVFGPLLAVLTFRDEEEAIALANDTRFGLAAGVWTNDVRRAHRVAHRLAAGTVWVNAYRAVGPQIPFGGMGMSGVGRESGIEAIRSYTETKAVWVELTGATRDPFVLG